MQQRKITQGYLILAFLVIGFVTYVTLTFNNTEKDFYHWDEIESFNDDWVYVDDTGKDSLISLPIKGRTKAGTTYRLTNYLPKSWSEGSVLCFKNDHLLVSVFVEGEEIYSLKVDERSTIGKSPGFSYVFIPLTSKMYGKLIEVEYTAVYSRSSFHINEFVLGEKSTIITGLLRKNAVALFLCGFSLCLGIVFIITYLIKHKTYEMNKSLLYLGIFAVPLSIWSMTETQTMQFFVRNMYSLQYVTYLSLAMCPIPFLLYYSQRHELQERISIKVISGLCLFITFICLALQAFGKVDLPDTLVFIHLSVAIVIGYTLYHSVRELMSNRYKLRKLSITTVSMIFMLICTVIDLIRFYFTVNADYSMCVRVGFFIYLGCTGLSTIFHSAKMDKTNKELEQLAYRDNDTGVFNRTAFMKHMEESTASKIAIVAIKLLELKEISVSFGETQKVELLKSVAKIIEFSFSNYGKIFRIAESEFIIVLESEIEKSYQQGMDNLKKRVHNSNKSRGLKICLMDHFMLYEREEKSIETALQELYHSLLPN